MRHISSAAAFAILLAACATAPKPVEEAKPAPKPPPADAPFAITDLTAPNQSLLGASLKIDGKVNGVNARDLTWTAKIGEKTAGEGKVTIDPGQDGTFSADADVKLGDSLDDLKQYQSGDTIEILLTATLGKLTSEHAVSIRTPQLPKVVVQTVQAQKTGPTTISVAYFVSIKNPNLFALQMTAFTYKASIGGKVFATESQPGGELPAAAGSEFEIQSTEATQENIGKDILKFMKMSSIDWGLAGEIQFESTNVPYTLTGRMNMSG